MSNTKNDNITRAAKAQFAQTMNEKDADIAFAFMYLTLSRLTTDGFPVGNKKFIEVLRVMANVLELVIEDDNDSIN